MCGISLEVCEGNERPVGSHRELVTGSRSHSIARQASWLDLRRGALPSSCQPAREAGKALAFPKSGRRGRSRRKASVQLVHWPKTTTPFGEFWPARLFAFLYSSVSYVSFENGTPIAITRFRSLGSVGPRRSRKIPVVLEWSQERGKKL